MSVFTSAASSSETLGALCGGDGLAGALNALDGFTSNVLDGTSTFDVINITLGTDNTHALVFGSDTYLYRLSPGMLYTAGELVVQNKISCAQDIQCYAATSKLTFGDGAGVQDTNLFRDSANVLKTDDTFIAGAGLNYGGVLRGYNAGIDGRTEFSSSAGLYDVNLYASELNRLKTDDDFSAHSYNIVCNNDVVVCNNNQVVTS